MFGHYLPNKNEDATVAPKSKFRELNKGSIYFWIHTAEEQVLVLFKDAPEPVYVYACNDDPTGSVRP